MFERGLSLVQLLVTLAVLAILAHLASPALRDVLHSQRRQVATVNLAEGLRSARTEAILRSQNVVIHGIDNDWSQGWRIILDISGKGHEDISNPLLQERRDSGQVTIAGNRNVASFVRFTAAGLLDPNGSASLGGTLHICDSDQTLSHHRVVLSATGRIRTERGERPEALCQPTSGQGAYA